MNDTPYTPSVTKLSRIFEPGDRVLYRGGWGAVAPVATTITDKDFKNGRRVYGNALGRWGYADQYELAPDA